MSTSVSEHRCVHGHTSAGDICCYIYALKVVSEAHLIEIKFWITMRCVGTVVLEPVQVLVALPADLTAIRLFLLHTNGSRIRDRRQRIDYGKGAIVVFLELLVLVTVLL